MDDTKKKTKITIRVKAPFYECLPVSFLKMTVFNNNTYFKNDLEKTFFNDPRSSRIPLIMDYFYRRRIR